VSNVLEMVPYRCCIEDVFAKILIFMKDDQVCQLLGLSEPYWNVLTKLISQDGYEIELPQSQVGEIRILQFLHFPVFQDKVILLLQTGRSRVRYPMR
jgi:hypothetical protein